MRGTTESTNWGVVYASGVALPSRFGVDHRLQLARFQSRLSLSNRSEFAQLDYFAPKGPEHISPGQSEPRRQPCERRPGFEFQADFGRVERTTILGAFSRPQTAAVDPGCGRHAADLCGLGNVPANVSPLRSALFQAHRLPRAALPRTSPRALCPGLACCGPFGAD